VLSVALYGVETANLALSNMRVSAVAINLADNASRVGLVNSNNIEQLREVDVDDVFTAALKQGTNWQVGARARITLSSLEADASGKQMIHWQRCLGVKSGTGYDSSYGATPDTAGTTSDGTTPGTATPGGMGDPNYKVTAPPSSGVMFVEINYDYQPVVSTQWLPGGAAKLHYTASYIVRDRRDFTRLFNPNPGATRMTCGKHTSDIS
jgi:hypothetical protein